MSAESSGHTFKLKLKLTAPLVQRALATGASSASADESKFSIARMDADPNSPLLIGARGGAALKDLLSTAPNPEEAIRAFQKTHGLNFATTSSTTKSTTHETTTPTTTTIVPRFAPAEKLLDLLHVSRSSVYQSLLDKLLDEMLLRIEELSQDDLQRVLEATFPYIEFRELRKIPIAILARQEETPASYLRELTENRRIHSELPVHVRRKILHVDNQELHYFVEQCTQQYIEEQLEWYLTHPSFDGGLSSITGGGSSSANGSNGSTMSANGGGTGTTDLWNVASHMPSPSSSRSNTQNPFVVPPEERRRQSAALATLSAMLGDSETLYGATLEILKEYIVSATIPGSNSFNSKEYVDYVPFLGALRSDLANLQRDKTTPLMRTDPMHKFIWFLERAMKTHHQHTHSHQHHHHNSHHAMDVSQLHELLTLIKKLRLGDVPMNKKFKKKTEMQDEEGDHFEIVLGPPPVDQLLFVLDKIAKMDVRFIFAEPVPDDVPNYKDVVKEPMDLSTMKKKAKKGKYKSLESFMDDFNLMIKNCLAFNQESTVFYKEGKRIGKKGMEIIEKNVVALRGEPQRIRAKKRKKSGSSEAFSMLTSSGVATLKDFGDVDQTGMVPEGICDETLADVALLLCDPPVKQMLCDSLLKTLVVCWQKREVPTDNLICRGLVQLLQIGNPASVRRMLRKKDYVLRMPQVVTMRVVLPLLIRSMASSRHGGGGGGSDLSCSFDATLWENMLRASSAIRSVVKAFVLQCLKDHHHLEMAVQLLDVVVSVEDDLVFRDRVFLHALGEIVLHDVKAHASAAALAAGSSSSGTGDHQEASHRANGVVEMLKNSSVWRSLVDGFFVKSLAARIQAAATQADVGSIVQYEDADADAEKPEESEQMNGSERKAAPSVVKAFADSVLHEKTLMVLSSAVHILEKAGSAPVDVRLVVGYLHKTLGTTRLACGSLDEFELLWQSGPFHRCRGYYEQLLGKREELRMEIFSSDYSGVAKEDDKEKETESKSSETLEGENHGVETGNHKLSELNEGELEAGEVDEDVTMNEEPVE